ncbi:MAG: DUF4830 domain-containing protein [Oscillospiraceae bacterium]|nr:DUF4830 domain-containing protein [Oscillospiraceae bacterium]
MFIVTAHVPRKRLIAGGITALCCCLAVAAALILTLGGKTVPTTAELSGVRSNEDRIAYLSRLGWQTTGQSVTTEELLIPETFDESYADYLALQSAQGFDLTKYTGKRIKRYTYELTNYPDSAVKVRAALLIYRNKVIGGQLQAVDGSFVLPLSGKQ